ncbi:MAG: tRNA pseudouridine(55) synthase TruB [Candidatus Sulfotelmatobacter sp.]
MNGVLIIDKPGGLTSHDVVNRVRRILHERSVGHLGTLDPLATGVLPLVIGNLTRLAQFYTASEKSYEGVIRFGFATDTYDAEGEPAAPAQPVLLDLDQVVTLAAGFRGVIEQMPPSFSAKKIHGVPAYKLARKKKEVVLQPVQVEIKEFEILAVEADRARFHARVASGTYMRSVAHEMGQKLGCGAHLESLRRTAVAEFSIADAHTLEELEAAANTEAANPEPGDTRPATPQSEKHGTQRGTPKSIPHSLEDLFVHPRLLLPQFPSVTADEVNAARIRAGRPVNLPELSRARQVKVFSGQKNLIAIATRVAGTLFHPRIVLQV